MMKSDKKTEYPSLVKSSNEMNSLVKSLTVIEMRWRSYIWRMYNALWLQAQFVKPDVQQNDCSA